MVENTVVERPIQAGYELLEGLTRDNFDVTAAWWMKPVEDSNWTFYLATPVFEQEGPKSAYRAIVSVRRRSLRDDGVNIDPALGPITVVGANDPITQDVLTIRKRFSGRGLIRYGTVRLGGIDVERVTIYPQLPRHPLRDLPWEKRKLRTDVEQVTKMGELITRLSPQESYAREQIVASGFVPDLADYWLRKRREEEGRKSWIPAGTVVDTQVVAWWSDKLEDDPNPLLRVKAPDGAEGLTFKNNTEAA